MYTLEDWISHRIASFREVVIGSSTNDYSYIALGIIVSYFLSVTTILIYNAERCIAPGTCVTRLIDILGEAVVMRGVGG
jgi:hypothetical protein